MTQPDDERASLLVFACGNPSRGDDALGPALFELLEKYTHENARFRHVELLVEYQLQIEHALDLEHRKGVLFIDASVSCPAPYDFQPLSPQQDGSYTTHAMSPAAVLAVYKKINPQPPPPAFMLSIRGYQFELGQALTEQARLNLRQSFEFARNLLEMNVENWHTVLKQSTN